MKLDEKVVAALEPYKRGRKPRHLFLDIETSPITGQAWGIYQQDMLFHEMGQILMVGYMWEGDKKPSILTQRTHGSLKPSYKQEKRLLEAVYELMDSADIITGYNAKNFDVKEINARFIKYGIPVPAGYHILDPLRMLKAAARFPSHKMGDVVEYLKIGHKLDTGGKYLWKRVMDGDESAWKHMEEYCKEDVRLCREVFLRVRGLDRSSFNYDFYTRLGLACKKCGSKNIKSRGYRYQRTGVRKDWKCRTCGHRFLGLLEKEDWKPIQSY